MPRTMYDSVNINKIPADAEMVAGYIGGQWATFNALSARFPHAVKVSIAVAARYDAQVLDVEKGDAEPIEAPPWVIRQRKRGQDPTVYCTFSAWPTVRSAFRQASVPEPHWWIAKYDNVAELPAGAVAKQYGGDMAGGYDLSIVADYWPGVDPAPIPEEHDNVNRTRVQATAAGTKATFKGLDQQDHPVNFSNVVGLVPIDKAAVWAVSTSLVDDQAVVFADPPTTVIVTFT